MYVCSLNPRVGPLNIIVLTRAPQERVSKGTTALLSGTIKPDLSSGPRSAQMSSFTPLPFPLTPWSETHDALLGLKDVQPSPLPASNPSKSFWIDSAPGLNPLAKEGSTGTLTNDADICIIGSGITGVSAAYHLSKILGHSSRLRDAPLKVVILDARDFCELRTRQRGRTC